MVLNVTCVMRAMWVAHADIYIIVLKDINKNPPPLPNTTEHAWDNASESAKAFRRA